MYIIQDTKVIVNFILSESHISIKSNFFDAILRNSPFEEGFSKQTNNLGNNTLVGFESRVILDGSQTAVYLQRTQSMFESRVILDGSQTGLQDFTANRLFESRVILDESQTHRDMLMDMMRFESCVTLVKVQAEANASACFFINSVYVKNPSCFPTKTERVVVAETGLEPAASGL